MPHTYSKHPGFTIPEILVALGIASIVMVGLFALVVNLATNSAATLKVSDQIRSNQTAIGAIQEDLRNTANFLTTNTITDSDSATSPSSSGWTFRGTSGDSRMIVLRTYATTKQVKDDTRTAVYYDDNVGGCPVGRDPVYNNIIYYIKNTTLYRRVLVETTPAKPYCGGSTNPTATIGQRRTCSNPGGSGMPSNCAEHDVAIAKNISKLTVQYYDTAAAATANADAYATDTSTAATAVESAKSIRIAVTTIGTPADNIADYTSYRRLTKGTLHD